MCDYLVQLLVIPDTAHTHSEANSRKIEAIFFLFIAFTYNTYNTTILFDMFMADDALYYIIIRIYTMCTCINCNTVEEFYIYIYLCDNIIWNKYGSTRRYIILYIILSVFFYFPFSSSSPSPSSYSSSSSLPWINYYNILFNTIYV